MEIKLTSKANNNTRRAYKNYCDAMEASRLCTCGYDMRRLHIEAQTAGIELYKAHELQKMTK